jgi:formiminotetrahydrofolate cyclodeaminase
MTSAQTLPEWLTDLASAAPAPGGGAAAAVNAALGAALLEMVANLTIGKPAYADHEEHNRTVLEQATNLRQQAIELIAADAEAFTALMATYKLPKATDEEKAARSAEIQRATAQAAEVPLQIAAVASTVVKLAGQLPGRSNPNVLSDVAVAASAAAAAIESAAINVQINLGGIKDVAIVDDIATRLARQEAAMARGRALVTDIRRDLLR